MMLDERDKAELLDRVRKDGARQLRMFRWSCVSAIIFGLPMSFFVIGIPIVIGGIVGLFLVRKWERKLLQGLEDGSVLREAEFQGRVAREL
jgi:hypothetical protein